MKPLKHKSISDNKRDRYSMRDLACFPFLETARFPAVEKQSSERVRKSPPDNSLQTGPAEYHSRTR